MASDKLKTTFNPLSGSFDNVQDVSTHVEGPLSASDNAIATYDSTTGKLIKNSGASVQTDGRVTAGADGSSSLDLITKQQLDAAIQGVDVKEGVKAASTVDLTLSGTQTVDTIALIANDRVLVKNQSAPAENGVYLVSAGAWTRALDSNTAVELNGAMITVAEGSQANTGWYQYQEIVTLGTDPVNFNQFFGAGTYAADGNGIELSGSTFSLELDSTTLSKSSAGLKVATGGITNNEVNASAGIAVSKLAALTANKAVVSDGSGFLTPSATTDTEISYVSGVTSAIQTQLNGKEASFVTLPISKGGTNSGTALNNDRVMQSSGGAIVEAAAITASRALASNASGIPVAATTTAAELDFVSGVTSAIQTQLNGKQASGSYATTDLANLGSTAINADLIFNKSAPTIKSKDDTAAATTNVSVKSGDTTVGSFASGTVNVISGNSAVTSSGDVTIASGTGAVASGGLNLNSGTGGTNTSGSVTIGTGTSSAGATGSVFATTGAKSGSQTGATGAVVINSGDYSSSSNSKSGDVTIRSGDKSGAGTAGTGDLTIRTGSASSDNGVTGALLLQSGGQTGTGTASAGTVTLKSGNTSGGNKTGGTVTVISGNSTGGSSPATTVSTGSCATGFNSGALNLTTGAGSNASGLINVSSGDVAGSSAAATTGVITVKSGDNSNSSTGASGAVNITTGNKSVGTAASGAINLTTGTATGTRGEVKIDALQLNMSSTKIVNVTDPSSAQDASTKAYTDTKQDRSTLTAKGDLYAATASNTVARHIVGTDGTFLSADSGQSTGLNWGAPASTRPYRSVTTTDAPSATTDETLNCSGASFTITLPTPAAGKIYNIIHSGTSLTQAYTLATTAGATIGGVASGSYVLYTNGESVEIQFDGTNFIIKNRKTNTAPASFTPGTTGLGTLSSVNLKWYRSGAYMFVYGSAVVGTATGSTAIIDLPGGMSIDTTAAGTAQATRLGTWYTVNATGTAIPATSKGDYVVIYVSGTTTGVGGATSVDTDNTVFVPATGSGIAATGTTISIDYKVPISGWRE